MGEADPLGGRRVRNRQTDTRSGEGLRLYPACLTDQVDEAWIVVVRAFEAS
jgi:hypothetical protein